MLLEAMLLLALLPTPSGVDCGTQVCVYAGDAEGRVLEGGAYKPGARLSRKARAKEAKANRKRPPVELSVALVGGRGSVFVDGRYLALTGPHAKRMLAPGKHELEVRDGSISIAVGVLTIPRDVAALAVVVYGER